MVPSTKQLGHRNNFNDKMVQPPNVKNDNRQTVTNGKKWYNRQVGTNSKMIHPPNWFKQQNDTTVKLVLTYLLTYCSVPAGTRRHTDVSITSSWGRSADLPHDDGITTSFHWRPDSDRVLTSLRRRNIPCIWRKILTSDTRNSNW